ncbi:hypothetical protein BDL97_04G117600 [Sphagnum fallax]|nr:hypothetical protein BDL97_04G117600 [Sphagnum fallax]
MPSAESRQQNQEMARKQSRHDFVPDLRSHGYGSMHSRPIDHDILTSDEEEEVDFSRSGNGSKSNLVRAATAFDYQSQTVTWTEESRHDFVPDLRSHGYGSIHSRPIDHDILTSDEEEEVDFSRSRNGSKSNLVRAATAFHYRSKWTHGCRQTVTRTEESRHDFVPDLRSHGYGSMHSRPIDHDILTSDEEEEVDFSRSGNGSKSNLVRAATAFDYQSYQHQEMGRKQSRHDFVPDLRSHGSRNGSTSNLVRAATTFEYQSQQNQEMGRKQSRHDFVPDLRSRRNQEQNHQ